MPRGFIFCIDSLESAAVRANTSIVFPVVSGILVWLAMPLAGHFKLVWVALVPLLLALDGISSRLNAFYGGYLYGLVYAALSVKWITVVDGFPSIAYHLMVAYIALFPGLFSLCLVAIRKRTEWPTYLVAPPLWATIEFLRVEIPLLPSPLALLGHSQYLNLPMLQVASLGSVYALSFAIVLVNAATVDILLILLIHRHQRGRLRFPLGALTKPLLVAVLTPVLLYGWGMRRLSESTPGSTYDPVLRVSVIQPNIPQALKWKRSERQSVLERHRELTLQVLMDQPDLIIWPETAVPGDFRRAQYYQNYVGELARTTSSAILVGSAAGEKGGKGGERTFTVSNSAFLVNDKGELIDEYRKVKMLPFAERVPLGDEFPWPDWMRPRDRSFTPGKDIHLLMSSGKAFGTVICWENLFPEFYRRFVLKGAQFMVNLTNEAWFKDSEGGYYLLASAVFRAVENGVALVRSANTGVSALIGPHGKIISRVTDHDGRDLMLSGTLTVDVPPPLAPTFYRRFGDIFAWGCVVLSLLMLLLTFTPATWRNKSV